MKPCPHCQEELEDDIKKCPYCGSSVTVEPLTSPETAANPLTTAVHPLTNALKVFLSVLSAIPFIGQIIAIVAAIIFMNSPEPDRKSFGSALLTAALMLFFLTCICCVLFGMLGALVQNGSNLHDYKDFFHE